MSLQVYFYKTESGNEPVREWLKSLDIIDKKIIGEDIMTVQFGWPIGMPLVKHLKNGLWEVRSNISSKRISRVIFFLLNNRIILVDGFIKKTQNTPKQNLEISLERKNKFQLMEQNHGK
jgi:phage-related protein